MPTGRIVMSVLALLLAGCSRSDPREPPPAGPDTAPAVSIEPRAGPAGTEVLLEAGGFPPREEVEIGFGPPNSEYEVIGQARSDARGRVRHRVTLPAWAEPGREYVFVVALASPSSTPRAVSVVFRVRAPGG